MRTVVNVGLVQVGAQSTVPGGNVRVGVGGLSVVVQYGSQSSVIGGNVDIDVGG